MKVFALRALDSTNTEALRLLADESPPFYVTATRQSGGRGRAANTWQSPEGNLYSSVVLADSGMSPLWATFAASLAAVELAEAECEGVTCRCKWPNDIIAITDKPRKLGGILAVKGRGAVVIGIGINLALAPIEGSCCLAEFGSELSPESAAAMLAETLQASQRLARKEGMKPLLAKWRRRAFCLGEEITLQSGGKTLQGVFADVDSNGALLLKTEYGIEAVYAADASWERCYWR